MSNTWWLVDGAMASREAQTQSLLQHIDAIALYADLGEQAASVGPWLLPGDIAINPANVALPARLGISQLHTDVTLEALLSHAKSIRQIRTDDGQSFFLRFADTRVLHAAAVALAPKHLARIKGPVLEWRCWDRAGTPTTFAPGPVNTKAAASSAPVVLSLKAFEALIDAGLPDQMLVMLQELTDPRLTDLHAPARFACLEKAAAFVQQHGIESFAFRRAVARHSVLSGATALTNLGFLEVLKESRQTGQVASLEQWALA
jgi:Domain of unknown function (DUF4123)